MSYDQRPRRPSRTRADNATPVVQRRAVAPGKRSPSAKAAARSQPPAQRTPVTSAQHAANAPVQALRGNPWNQPVYRPDVFRAPAEHDTPIQQAGAPDVRDAGGARATPPRLSGSGSAMPGTVQAKMESAFDTDFSAVRIHEGPQATAMGALAYTQGTDIHFAPGQYQPSTRRGQELLGHELTHVVQQSQGRVHATVHGKGMGINDDPSLEREADEIGARAARGESAGCSGAVAAVSVHAAGAAPVQMVRNTDIDKILTKLRMGLKKYNLVGKYTIPRSKVDKETLWKELTDRIDAETLAGMTPDAAATEFLKQKAEEAANDPKPQADAGAAPPQQMVFEPPLDLVDDKGKAVKGTPIPFTIPGLGEGRIALFKGVNEPSYKKTLAWMSHGIQASDRSKPAMSSRSFGFVVAPNAKMLRPEADGIIGNLADSYATESANIPADKTVPDMLVGAHNRTEFNQGMLQAASSALPKCDMAILYDFIKYDTVDARYETEEMKHLGFIYPPLNEVLDNTPGLAAYENWLMLCCRSKIDQIMAGKDRPEEHPKTVRAFNAE